MCVYVQASVCVSGSAASVLAAAHLYIRRAVLEPQGQRVESHREHTLRCTADIRCYVNVTKKCWLLCLMGFFKRFNIKTIFINKSINRSSAGNYCTTLEPSKRTQKRSWWEHLLLSNSADCTAISYDWRRVPLLLIILEQMNRPNLFICSPLAVISVWLWKGKTAPKTCHLF